MRRILITLSLGLLILGLLAACGGEATSTPSVSGVIAPVATPASGAATPVYDHSAPPAAAATSTTAAAAPAADAALDSTTGATADKAASTPSGDAYELAPVPPVAGSGGAADPASGPIHTGKPVAPNYQSPLSAGQVDDNAKFQDYLNYIHSYGAQNIHPIAVDQRLFVRVVDGQQKPVAGARVQLFDGSRAVFDGRTVSDGRVLFFPQAADATQASKFRALVSRGQQQVEATIAAGQPETTVTLPKLADNTGPVGLDLVFLLDSTGSMGDELATVNDTVDSIADRIEQLPGSSRPRFGLVTYRDRGDDFVTRSWDFTADTQQFADNLAQISAAGGGDYPESVDAGLHDAIHLPGWASDDTGRHLLLIVLVGDAPPHLDYANDYEYTSLLKEAVAAGIKIFPIAASGLNDQGEYIFRQFAQVTQGQFVFITYANGVSGPAGPATDKHVDDFTVQNLDGIVVNLVAGEIANQTGTGGHTGQQQPDPAGPVGFDATMPPQPDVAPRDVWASVGDFAGQVNTWLSGGSLPLWLLLVLVLGLWAGRGSIRAHRARVAGQPFLAAPAPGPAPRVAARVTPTPTPATPAAQILAPPAPYYAYVSRDAAGRDTTPLPSLPEETVKRKA